MIKIQDIMDLTFNQIRLVLQTYLSMTVNLTTPIYFL